MLEHDTTTPDIETASDAYARRFSGSAGRFLLEVQADAVNHLLQDTPAVGRVLEIGGGHGQLTQLLLDLGFEVWVQGSSTVCSRRVHLLMARSEYRDRLHFVASSLWALPFPDTSFDLVLGIRLLAHVERWRELLAEMARVCKHRLLLDYPPTMSANAFERWMFRFKRDIEGNTRPYFCYSFRELSGALRALGFERLSVEKEFFVPMVVHRALARQGLSRALERGSRALGLTRLVGGPVLLLAQRPDAMARLRPSLAPGEPRATSRVLLVAPEPFFTPVGTPLNVLQMCRALPELGHPVELLTLPMGETVPLPGIAYHRVPRLPWPHRVPVGFSISKAVYDFLLALAIVRRLRAQRYLAVHAIEESALYAMPIARWFGTPGIMDLDSDLCYQLRTNRSRLARLLVAPARSLRRRALRQSTCTLTVARTLSDLVRRESPGTPVFEVGDIPSEALLRAPDSGRVEALREEFGLGGRRLVIYTGNFDGRQGVELLVRAMPEITARCPEALLLLVGGEPRQVESMHRLAAARGVGASVRAIGKKPLEQMPEFMALADVLVSPRIEPLVTPFKVYAYMASGRPIVATDLPTHTDVLTPECAVLVPATPTGLADGILTVLADAALGQRLGRRARATVETEHGYATFKAKLGAVYAFALRESQLRAQSADDPMRVTSAP